MTVKLKNIISAKHIETKRDYSLRSGNDKPDLAETAKKFSFDYWDGDRKFGYGGYLNDGRWKDIAERFIQTYSLDTNDSILDIGSGKGFFLDELFNRKFKNIAGLEISDYAIEKTSPHIKNKIILGNAKKLPFEDNSFDFVSSINTLHNLEIYDLISALKEIKRVSRKKSYICVESYRSEIEKWNLMKWQLTCESFFSPQEWLYIFKLAEYEGDYEFIYFS